MDKQPNLAGYPVNSSNIIGVPTLRYKCDTCSVEATAPSNHVAPKCGTCFTYMELQPTKRVVVGIPPPRRKSALLAIPYGREVVNTDKGVGILTYRTAEGDEIEIGGGEYPIPEVNPCATGHKYVNVGFNTIKMVCKHCDIEE